MEKVAGGAVSSKECRGRLTGTVDCLVAMRLRCRTRAVRKCAFACACVRLHVCVCVYIHLCRVYLCVYICARACVHACVRACVDVCVCVCALYSLTRKSLSSASRLPCTLT